MATTVIPASDFVDVSISLQTPVGEPVNFQRALLLSDEPGFVAYMVANPSLGRVLEISGTGASLELEREGMAQGHSFPSTLGYVNTYLSQNPNPPLLRLAYVDRIVTANNPAEYYWDIITEVANQTNIYHVFYVGNQAQLLDDEEGVALCGYFDRIASIIYTPPGGGTPVPVPAAPRVLINHLQCGADANVLASPATPAAAMDLSRALTLNSATYLRTQLYYPDSPTGVTEGATPADDTAVDFYSNAFSAAVVGQLCSGSRFNRAPGALSTANISNIQSVRVVGNRDPIVGMRDTDMNFVPFVSPNIEQVQVSSSVERNLLFYVQTTSANVQFTYRLGSCPNSAPDGIPLRYTDQTIAIDWLEQEIVVEYLALIVNAGPLPFTQTGINKVREVIEKVFERGKRLGILNPGYGPADGERVIVPNIEDLTADEKQRRELGPDNPITFTTQLAESLNFLTINGTVQP